jgi:5'-nucleotidase
MEACLLGARAMAFSQVIEDPAPLSFAAPAQLGADLVRRAAHASWPDDVLLNVNFPAVDPDKVSGIHVVRHGRRKLGDDLRERFDPRGRAYYWIGPQRTGEPPPPDTDLAVVEKGGISVTPIGLDLTHRQSLPDFAAALRPEGG